MELWKLFLPLVFSAAIALVSVGFQSKIAAKTASWMAVGGACGIGLVGFIGSGLVALQFWAHSSLPNWFAQWCGALGNNHAPVSETVGVTLSVFVIVGVARLAGFTHQHRSAKRTRQKLRSLNNQPVLVANSNEVFAYAVPGATPLTVVSSELLVQLEVNEQAIVLAHEEAHHRHRHDRFLLVGRGVAALFPPARVFTRALEHTLERWADEHAATVVGDRKLVAVTVARTALLANRHVARLPFGALGFSLAGPFSTTQRVKSLLRPPRPVPGWALGVSLVALLSLATQVHHFETLLRALCPM